MTVRPLLIGLRELKSYVSDIGALAFGLALPLALVALMLGAFGGEVTYSGTAYMVDNDRGPYAEQLLNGLREINGLTVDVLDADEAANRIDRSAILMYTEIPAGFSAGIEAGAPLDVVQHQRGGGGQESQIVSSMIRGVLEDLTVEQELRAQITGMLAALDVESSAEQVDAQVAQALANLDTNPPVVLETVRPGGEEDADLAASLFPRMASWMVLFAVSNSAQAFVLERRAGTLERLLTTRLTRNELFVGKWIANFLRGLVQFVALFLIGGLIFDFFTLGSWINTILFGVVVTAAVASLGLIIATLSKTENQATWGAVFFTMIMAIFGGTFFEGGAESVFGVISNFTVTHYMNTGFDRLLIDGDGLGGVVTQMLVLAGIAVVGVVVARMLFRPVSGGGA